MLNKEKYNLQQMDISTKTKDGKILFFELKFRGKTIHQQIYPCGVFACDAMAEMIGWLEQEYKPPILDDVEKAYLSAVIKPFRKDVRSITKQKNNEGYEWLRIIVEDNNPLVLPGFKKETMYKGMHAYKEYTLEELGL